MTTPPDFGGHEIEEGLLEDLGGPAEDRAVSHQEGVLPGDHEAHAPGQACKVCGQVIQPGQDVRRRADGGWMHEVCPGRI